MMTSFVLYRDQSACSPALGSPDSLSVHSLSLSALFLMRAHVLYLNLEIAFQKALPRCRFTTDFPLLNTAHGTS